MVDDCAELERAEQLFDVPVQRILLTDLPQYLAVVTRVRVDCRTLGPAGGILSSSVVPRAQVVFPQNALVKPIRIGLQVVIVIVTMIITLLYSVVDLIFVVPQDRVLTKVTK